MEILITRIVAEKLKTLGSTLYANEYFGFLVSAEDYVSKMTDFIYDIPNQTIRKTKKSKHGKYYVGYLVKNKRTQYFITFNKKGDKYVIKNIFTSHESGYDTYIKG